MGTLFSISISSGILLASMYLIYKWMLAGENQHGYNRAILWIIYISAIALPLIAPSVHRWLSTPVPVAVMPAGIVAEIPVATIAEPAEPALLPRVLLAIYLAGIAVCMVYTVIVAVRLIRIISRGERHECGRHTLIITSDSNIAPFSWLRFIVMSRKDFTSSAEIITSHESRHLALNHWIDLLVAQLIAIFQWYNPAAWLMREELKTVHEYQADEAVLASGADAKQYQMLLIKKAVGTRFPSLANSLNHSKLKKRVTMMYKSKSSAPRRLRALALIPAGMLAMGAINLPAVASALSEASEATLSLSNGKITENAGEGQKTISIKKNVAAPEISNDDAKVLAVASVRNEEPSLVIGAGKKNADKQAPEKIVIDTKEIKYFINGEEVSQKVFLAVDDENVEEMVIIQSGDITRMEMRTKNTPEDNSTTKTKRMPTFYVNGVKQDPSSQISSLDKDQIESISVMRNRESIEKYGNPEGAILITLKDQTAPEKPATESAGALNVADQMPQFPGGESEMMKWVAEHIIYPEEAIKKNLQGIVVVRFVVKKDGSIGETSIVRGIDPVLDEEAMRVIKTFPNFTPGKSDGKPVDVNYTMPISFKLS